MGDLEGAYASWRRSPFPPGSSRESLDELHADLALADAWVAESVVPFVETGLYHPAQVNVIDELSKLRSRAAELARGGDADDRQLANSYWEYTGILLRVYESFLEHGRPSE